MRNVFDRLTAGRSVDDALADYPYRERADVLAALGCAAALTQER